MCLPCQGGQGCFDIDECTLSEGVSFSSPLIFATYHLISNQICKFSSSCSHLNCHRSIKSLSTASPMHKTYQINYCGPNTNCNNLPGTSVYYGLNMLSAALLFFILLLVPFESLFSFGLFLLLSCKEGSLLDIPLALHSCCVQT